MYFYFPLFRKRFGHWKDRKYVRIYVAKGKKYRLFFFQFWGDGKTNLKVPFYGKRKYYSIVNFWIDMIIVADLEA